MKLPVLGSLNAHLPPLADDITARLKGLFEECPHLVGFTVQNVSALPEGLRPEGMDEGLVVTDMAIHPLMGREQCEAIYEAITLALLEVVCDRPGAQEVLPGRTFARCVH